MGKFGGRLLITPQSKAGEGADGLFCVLWGQWKRGKRLMDIGKTSC